MNLKCHLNVSPWKKCPNPLTRSRIILSNRVYQTWQKCWFWWESKKDKWFLNKAFDQRKEGRVEPEPSVWITANDMEHHMDHMIRQGYKYHIDE